MATDVHEPSKLPQPSSGNENITYKEDDVKVCDICGDAGQEDALATCFRCLDGAEHIYCMKTMLDKLPDGDWLCEECKFKEEYVYQKVSKFEVVTKIQEQSYSSEITQHGRSTICSVAPPTNDGSVIKEDMSNSRTLQSQGITFKRHGENANVNTVTCETAYKRSPVSTETLVPQDVSLLSPEDSLTNPDYATKLPSNSKQSSESLSMFEGLKVQTSSGSISSSSRDGFEVMSGPQLKPNYFKNTNTNTKPKVKQLLGPILLTENATGKFPSKITRKGGLTRGIVKSSSFKTEGVSNGFELVNEKQSVMLTQMKNSSVERNKELVVLEGENSSALDFCRVLDRGIIDGDNSGYNGEIPSHSSRSSIGASSVGLNLQNQGQIPREGRPMRSCSIDNHCVSAIMLSADQIPLENASRSNKWRASRKTIMSNQETLKCSNTTNQHMESPIPSFGHSAEVANKELSLHCFSRMNSQEARSNTTKDLVFDKSEPTLNTHAANQTEFYHEAGAGRLNPFGDISKDCDVKASEQILPKMDPYLSNIPRTTVIPELEFFWQGGFEVLRAGRLLECCDGLQAHFSSYASGKVLEVAKKFPPHKVQLQEVPSISSWPQQFQGNRAKDNNIALFFFAKDIESYRNNYCKLLEKMLKFDLALKGNLGGFELLIFPSNKLSENSQRWNRLLFLWGIFKERSSRSLEVLPNTEQDPCKTTMDVKLPTTLPEASKYQETNSSQNSDEADKHVAHIAPIPVLSKGTENKIFHARDYLCNTSVDAKILSENPCPPPLDKADTCSESSVQQKNA